MSEQLKKNCNRCKHGMFGGCETLKQNETYQAIKAKDDILDSAKYEFKEQFICDDYESLYIEYPIEVSKINNNCKKEVYQNSRVGRFVKIRPCNKKYENKTYLGLYLGDLPINTHISHDSDSKELSVSFHTNPAIFVFDLNTIIYGCESWWGVLEKEEDLKALTDQDIDNVWYVKALKVLNKDK